MEEAPMRPPPKPPKPPPPPPPTPPPPPPNWPLERFNPSNLKGSPVQVMNFRQRMLEAEAVATQPRTRTLTSTESLFLDSEYQRHRDRMHARLHTLRNELREERATRRQLEVSLSEAALPVRSRPTMEPDRGTHLPALRTHQPPPPPPRTLGRSRTSATLAHKRRRVRMPDDHDSQRRLPALRPAVSGAVANAHPMGVSLALCWRTN